jgi:hypothetical protein
VAYVELKGRGGKPELHRFKPKPAARLNIKAFDAGQHVTPEAVVFAAPKGRETLSEQNKHQRAYVKRLRAEGHPPRSAHIKGTMNKPPRRHDHKIENLTLRDPQTGMFQFSRRGTKEIVRTRQSSSVGS